MAVLGVSAGQSGITSNWPQVQQALDAYVKVRNQSTYASVLEKMGNIAMRAAKNTAFSERENIKQSISTLPNIGDTKPRKGGGQYVGQYKVINWERKLKGLPTLGNSKSRVVKTGIICVSYYDPFRGRIVTRCRKKETRKRNISRARGLGVSYFMDGKYKGFIKSRQQGSKWLRIGWALAAAKLGKPFTRGDFGPGTMERLSGQRYGGGANIKINGAGKFEFEIFNGVGVFDHRRRPPGRVGGFLGTLPIRPSNQIANARAIQERGLKIGVFEEIQQMIILVRQRNKQLWDNIKSTSK